MDMKRRRFTASLGFEAGALVGPGWMTRRTTKVWPNERPGLGVTVDLAQLTPAGEATTGVPGITSRRPDGSLTHW